MISGKVEIPCVYNEGKQVEIEITNLKYRTDYTNLKMMMKSIPKSSVLRF